MGVEVGRKPVFHHPKEQLIARADKVCVEHLAGTKPKGLDYAAERRFRCRG